MAIGDKSYTVEINDSEFEREGWKNARYKGTKLTAANINKFTQGDISFGQEPVIEQFSKTIYVFNQANTSFETIAGIFYPNTDEFGQTLNDTKIVGVTRFKIDRAVTFNVGNPNDFSQIEPGSDPNDPSFNYFDTLLKTDFALFNSCSIKFFDNTNNGFTKPSYIVGYNRGEFQPAAVYFQSASSIVEGVGTKVETEVIATAGDSFFDYELSDGGRFYINPNVEDWFISQNGASGSQGTLGGGNTAITINHLGDKDQVNSIEGYFFGLSKRLLPKKDSYYISFNQGIQGPGTLNEKNLIKAFDIHELENSGSNIDLANNRFNIKETGRYGGNFKATYDGASKEEFVLFRERKTNNTIHLDFNLEVEAPAGVGNGGVIIPSNLHPDIKEQLSVYLFNAGLGPEGGSSANFSLGSSVSAVQNQGTTTQQSSVIQIANIAPLEAAETTTGREPADSTTTTTQPSSPAPGNTSPATGRGE